LATSKSPQTTTADSKSVTKSASKSSKMTSMADLLASQGEVQFSFKRGQQIEGTVVLISPKEVLLNVGGKSEATVFHKELTYLGDLIKTFKMGDKVPVTVIVPENDAGQVVVSLRKGGGADRWQRLSQAVESDETIAAFGVEVNRGGILLDFEGIRGFLPASQAELGDAKLEEWIGRRLEVKVLEADQKANRLIFTQRTSSPVEVRNSPAALKNVEIGDKFESEVTSLLPFGAIVKFTPKDGESLEGLVHVSELSWSKVADPAEVCKVGDKLEVVVLTKDDKSGRLSLSVKSLTEDPWSKIAGKFEVDQTISGMVKRLTQYGAFVELEGGIEGLIHISKIPPDFSINVGDKVSCTIESIDAESRRIGLSPVLTTKPLLYR